MEMLNVIVVDPDHKRRTRLTSIVNQSEGIRVAGAGESLLQACEEVIPPTPINVIVLNIDQPEMLNPDTWATTHLVLRSARVVALTRGDKGDAIKAALAARVAGLHRLDVHPTALTRAIRNAAQGIADYDPALVETAKTEMLLSSDPSSLHLGDVAIDLTAREVVSPRGKAQLTRIESQLLAHLAMNKGRVVSQTDLLKAVWHTEPDSGGTGDQVYSCVKRLRRKIEIDPRHPLYLQSVRGVGYILTTPAADVTAISHGVRED